MYKLLLNFKVISDNKFVLKCILQNHCYLLLPILIVNIIQNNKIV